MSRQKSDREKAPRAGGGGGGGCDVRSAQVHREPETAQEGLGVW